MALTSNSLESLSANWRELNAEIQNVNFFLNYLCVLGVGLVRYEKVNLSVGEKGSMPFSVERNKHIVQAQV